MNKPFDKYQISLSRPEGERRFGCVYVPRYDADKKEVFNRGERVILVDGLRWGRTHVTWHGCHGTTTTFEQKNGGIILRKDSGKQPSWNQLPVEVRSANADRDTSTEQMTIDKVCDLIKDGRLRHPDVVEQENEQKRNRARAASERRDAAEAEKFSERARQAVVRWNGSIGTTAAYDGLVNEIVEAMRWAQTQ